MNTFHTLKFGKALVAFSFVGMLLASPANSKIIGSAAVANVSVATIATAAHNGLSGESTALDTSHSSSVILPPLAALAPSQKWGALFPVVGVIAAVAATQLLRRRRIAQLRSDSSSGQ